MSSIPNKAIPHAAPALAETELEDGETITLARRVRDQADRVAGLVRDNPKAALAAGAAVAAGVAAAIPLVKGRRAKAGGAAPARKAPAKGKKTS